MLNQRFNWSWSLLILIAATALSTGCVLNGRRVLLKEYGPSVPPLAEGNLKGATICLKDFTCVPNLTTPDPADTPEEPTPFKYLDLSREQDKLWDKEMKALEKRTTQADWKEIGNMRNGFGMVMSHVYALNDPAAWIAESLKYDLEAHGAKVVDASQSANADVSILGKIELCRVDMYFMVNATLLVGLDVQPKGGQSRHKQIHTRGTTAAMMASEGEYFHALRDARQKFSILATREISQALKGPVPSAASAK